uniref:helix-turn-helix domain-containing protein n=1 Tax=Algoriphagus sp. TaxID=1872435 RepID=UPI0040487780
MQHLEKGVTLENLPRAVALLTEEVSEIKSLLLQQANAKPSETDFWFNLDELCEYLPDRPSKQTVYDWVHNRIIPVHKGPKKLRFLKSEIDAWLIQGRKKTHAELQEESIQFLKPKKR